jgi:acetyl-CoA carboxylase biotin carboxylase subunit
LMIASGEKLNFSQADVKMNGHAIEARVYAEDPETFVPSPGTITGLRLPETDSRLRIDHALQENGSVPPFYDPLLAKVIAWGSERAEASNRLIEALADFQIEGIKTTIPLNLAILKRPEYLAGNIDTGFIDKILRNT